MPRCDNWLWGGIIGLGIAAFVGCSSELREVDLKGAKADEIFTLDQSLLSVFPSSAPTSRPVIRLRAGSLIVIDQPAIYMLPEDLSRPLIVGPKSQPVLTLNGKPAAISLRNPEAVAWLAEHPDQARYIRTIILSGDPGLDRKALGELSHPGILVSIASEASDEYWKEIRPAVAKAKPVAASMPAPTRQGVSLCELRNIP